MAAIEKRQKEISDGLASAERAKKDLDLGARSKSFLARSAEAKPSEISFWRFSMAAIKGGHTQQSSARPSRLLSSYGSA
jgi:hypothetical protein